MNLYKIEQKHAIGYDTYSAAVVVAKSAIAATSIHPDGEYHPRPVGTEPHNDGEAWACQPSQVTVTFLGRLGKDAPFKAGDVVTASYHVV